MSFTDRFSERAGAYVASRPSYPVPALDVILAGLGDPSALRVADIGAGTGISARAMAARGPTVVAIEPNGAMRGAAEADARVTWIDATAEHTTLADASVDAVVAFQAWHWVDHASALAEAQRIVRGGGRLAVVYNERDETDAFTAGYGDVVRTFAEDRTEERRAEALAAFEGIEPARTRRTTFANAQTLDRAGVHRRAKSSSYLPQTGERARALHAALDTMLDADTRERYALHLVTIVVCVDV